MHSYKFQAPVDVPKKPEGMGRAALEVAGVEGSLRIQWRSFDEFPAVENRFSGQTGRFVRGITEEFENRPQTGEFTVNVFDFIMLDDGTLLYEWEEDEWLMTGMYRLIESVYIELQPDPGQNSKGFLCNLDRNGCDLAKECKPRPPKTRIADVRVGQDEVQFYGRWEKVIGMKTMGAKLLTEEQKAAREAKLSEEELNRGYLSKADYASVDELT